MEAITLFLLSITSWLGLYSPAPVSCVEPISYNVGIFDRRFQISYGDLVRALSEAESIWESAIQSEGGQVVELFSYDAESGYLPVHLIYDSRQETTDVLYKLEGVVRSGEEGYRTLEAEYKYKQGEYLSLKSPYEALVADFDRENALYQSKVEAWNNGPRTSKSEFQKLEELRLSLEKMLSEIRLKEQNVNRKASELNQLALRLNALAAELNLGVEKYNEIGADRGEAFIGGLYIDDSEGERIEIYEFSNHDKLVRVLAHELGHALGLEHVGGSESIMGMINQGTKLSLSPEDMTELKRVCENI